jgi:hypothetical protein
MARLTDRPLNSSTPGDQVEDKNDDSDYQQKVNQVAAERDDESAQQPQDEKNDDDCPKHGAFS